MASGERKLVALLFADLSGFTALASSLDPEEVYAFVRPGLDAMRRIVEDHGGSVPHVMGDGFMAVFGVPTAHEDDAERAVRAGLAVRDHARTLARGRAGIRFPEVHAGVNSGEVMVAPSTEAGGFSILGDPVNVAARLADLAPPGVVLVAEQTKRRTEHAVRYGPGRGYRAKGKPRPVVAFEAIEVRSALPAGRAAPAVSGGFVDREQELEALERALAATLRERRSALLVVTAEPGGGKTRLATEFVRRRPDAILLTGRCSQLAGEVVRLGQSIGSLRIAGLGLAAGARACLREGNPSRAGRQLSSARHTLLRGGVRNEMLEVEFVDAGIHLDRGSWRGVAGPAGRGADGAQASGWVLYESMGPMLVGRALLGAGRLDQAAAELERALASATAAGAAGTAALAGAALEQARVLAGHPPTGPPAPPPPDEVEVEAIRSEAGAAAAAFARAVGHWRQLGLTVWLGRALSLQAAAARRAGDRPAADRLLAQAGEVLDRLKTPAKARPTVLSPLADQRDGTGG